MKHISILIAICALVFAQMAHAAKIVTTIIKDGITYQLYDDNTAVLTKGQGASDDIVLPSAIAHNGKDYTLTRIGNNAFSKSNVLSVIIPNTVTTIGNEAFYHCSSMQSVTIPNSVSTIGGFAFAYCNSLCSVTVGAFVQFFGENALGECSNLQEITFCSTTPPALENSVFSELKNVKINCQSEDKKYEDFFYDYKRESGFSIKPINQVTYRNAVLEAITLAAGRNGLTPDDESLSSYTTAISEGDDVAGNELAAHKVIALAGIRQALPSDGLLEEEQTVVNGKITKINSATSLAGIYTPQKEALDWISLHPEKADAMSAIEAAMQGNTNSKYLNGLVKEQVAAIISATDAETITNKKQEAVNKLQSEIGKYIAIKDEVLGTLGEKQDGPAVEVIDQNDNVLKLYNPKKVNFIKVKVEE
ncbi:MAG: leucine-rich repeat protein [Bacteroidales bacterium]|nr:leucine-rich repeat protein [Bacteroidales bacterium]